MTTHDYVSIYTPPVELAPSTTCLVVVDMMYATGHPDFGLGQLLAAEGRFEEASYRFARIAEKVLPNTLRLLQWARAHDMRRVFLTYGSEVSDYSDLSPQIYELCRATKNRERRHNQHDESHANSKKSQRLDVRKAIACADEPCTPQDHEQGRRRCNRQSGQAHGNLG